MDKTVKHKIFPNNNIKEIQRISVMVLHACDQDIVTGWLTNEGILNK